MILQKNLPKFRNGQEEDLLYAASDRALNAALREFEPFLGIHTAAELRDFYPRRHLGRGHESRRKTPSRQTRTQSQGQAEPLAGNIL